MNPIGRQFASGLSLLLSAMRFFTSSAAHGCNGRPSLNPDPTLPKVASGTWSSETSGGAGAAPLAGATGFRTFRHTPERSGLPSAVLGAEAVADGTGPAGYWGHCADRSAEVATMIPIEPAALSHMCMSSLHPWPVVAP